MKFGGTSLEDEEAFQRVARIVSENLGENLVVVVSAMSGVTDALIGGFQTALKGETSEALQNIEYHFERHLKVSNVMGATARESMRVVIEQSRREIIELLRDVCANRRTTAETEDAMVSQGERLSANLVTIVLAGYGIPAAYVDARRCIITNQEHGNAKPLIDETWRQTRAELFPLLETKRVPVLGGFIAATRNWVTTTLGRGSSDYSATLFSAALGARETQIWTDVDGVMSADPCLVKSARTVSHLSYEEAAELARLGARVLHAKMIQPVVEQKIPIRILNSRNPQFGGTVISARAQTATSRVKAIAHKTNQTRMEIVNRSNVGISLACEEVDALPALIADLQQVGVVETRGQRAIISCVGEGLQSVGTPANVIGVLKEIDPALTWYSTSNLNLISMVDVDVVGPVVRKLHQGLFI